MQAKKLNPVQNFNMMETLAMSETFFTIRSPILISCPAHSIRTELILKMLQK